VPDAVKRRYLAGGLNSTVVTTRVDGVPHRVLRTELVDRLERAGRGRALLHAVANAARFRRLTGASWTAMLREGLAMRHGRELSWAQVIMAANTPMLLRSGLVDGRTDAGVLAAGQVVGLLDDLPSVAEVISNVVDQAVEVIRRLGGDL
jgi:NAD(P)H-dependent flavin oxidoreductase YrpB (nitropropane dioxygenase family)